MLARSFLSAADLGIADVEQQALVKVLDMLELGELVHGKYPLARMFRGSNEFNMAVTLDESSECGSIGCLCGWAHLASGRKAFVEIFSSTAENEERNVYALPTGLRKLFRFGTQAGALFDIQPEQAAAALRNYLTTGEANWAEAMATTPAFAPALSGTPENER